MNTQAAQEHRFPLQTLSTRNAVERAIDLSRSDRQSTWEGIAARMRKIIKPWEAVARAGKVEKADE